MKGRTGNCKSGHSRQRCRKRRKPLARRGEPESVSGPASALAGIRGSGWACDERSSPADLGFRGSRRALDKTVRRTSLARLTGISEEQIRRGKIRTSGNCARLGEKPWWTLRARGLHCNAHTKARQKTRLTRARHIFNENRLTPGFARHFATYKRLNLLLHNAERLSRILTNRDRPAHLIIAGKANPQDAVGQVMIK